MTTMKMLLKVSKPIAFVLSLLLLLQSCKVYQNKTVSLKKAMKEGRRVKVKMKDARVIKFDRIVYSDSSFYGIKKKRGSLLQTPLRNIDIESIRMKNKTISFFLTLGASTLLVMLSGIVLLSAVCCSIGGGFNFPN